MCMEISAKHKDSVGHSKVERKFIIDRPDMLTMVNNFLFDTIVITQTFLKNKDGGDRHVRMEVCKKEVKYFYGRKICDTKNNLRLIAEDREISRTEYEDLIDKEAHPKAAVIQKVRYQFEYREQIFNLDYLDVPVKNPNFDPNNEDPDYSEPEYLLSSRQAILMIELFSAQDTMVEFPRQITSRKNITNDLAYTTKALAKLIKQQSEEAS